MHYNYVYNVYSLRTYSVLLFSLHSFVYVLYYTLNGMNRSELFGSFACVVCLYVSLNFAILYSRVYKERRKVKSKYVRLLWGT